MKNRLINIVKWFLIVLGVLFILETVLIIGAILGLTSLSNINKFEMKTNYKELQPALNYIENYYKKNNEFPKNINDLKPKKDIEYTYKLDKNGTCYSIKSKNIKNNNVKEYQHCTIQNENSSSNSQNYVEYVEK